jgi:DNA mismatch repair protein MLH3
MTIKRLPSHVAAEIRSSAAINSLQDAVAGLLKNALDASATKINISVDFARGNCTVEDDGLGIPPDEFSDDGGLCQPHCTSKYPPLPSIHGRHGMFLASLATLSLVTVTSHHANHLSHNTISIHNSTIIARQLPTSAEQRILAFPHGTRVVVRDLFGSMPVRVKHRAHETDRTGTKKEFDSLLHFITATLLAWPGRVSVSVSETRSNQAISLNSGRLRNEGPGSEKERIISILAQAGLLDDPSYNDWVTVGVSAPGITISGFISLHPVATKSAQFMSLGIETISRGILYDDVNKLFARSSFGAVVNDASTSAETPTGCESFTRQALQMRKGVDRWPAFSVKIELSAASVQRSLLRYTPLEDNEQSLVAIGNLMRLMMYQFLKKHHFRPESGQRPLERSQSYESNCGKDSSSITITAQERDVAHIKSASAPKLSTVSIAASRHRRRTQDFAVPKATANSPFTSWPHVKVGQAADPTVKKLQRTKTDSGSAIAGTFRAPRQASHLVKDVQPLFDDLGRVQRRPFEVESEQELDDAAQRGSLISASSALQDGNAEGDETFLWTDPKPQKKCVVSARTGFVVNKDLDARDLRPHFPKDLVSSTDSPRSLIDSALLQWHDSAFSLGEACIPRLKGADNPGQVQQHYANVPFTQRSHTGEATVVEDTSMKISKTALSRAAVIAQVDRKFILFKVHTSEGDGHSVDEYKPGPALLVLLDQHAADERCGLERLMQDYFPQPDGEQSGRAVTEILDKVLQFELSAAEGALLVRFGEHFEHWGIIYEVSHPAKSGTQQEGFKKFVKVQVQALPPSILERCRQEPRLLIELLRKEIWRLRDDPVAARTSTDHQKRTADRRTPHKWVSRFHGCPTGILDMLHSRSCRSAIMFNDELSKEQCTDLLSRLARCAFPFQCAHGRPTMTPVVDLGTEEISKEDGMPSEGRLAADLREWKRILQNDQTAVK